MNIDELMLGDWVDTPNGNYRIEAIQDNDVVFTDCPVMVPVDGSFDAYEINPIEITKEILEKNGFKKDESYSSSKDMDPYAYSNDSLTIIVSLGTRMEIVVNNSGYISMLTKAPDSKIYVHELQHFLKLNDVNESIVL